NGELSIQILGTGTRRLVGPLPMHGDREAPSCAQLIDRRLLALDRQPQLQRPPSLGDDRKTATLVRLRVRAETPTRDNQRRRRQGGVARDGSGRRRSFG